ncbi:DUF6223 family protein [Streptomyces werraensis]|uniref:DUF6223 family protein n=1 Tax=Streptomyces werraensis TaxID=68284 RepID=UPI003447FA63
MSAPGALMAAAEGGIIGDGRTGANLALAAGALGLALAWPATSRAGRRMSTGRRRTGGTAAVVMGAVGTVLAVLHLATADGGPGTGNGLVGAVVAVPLGLGAVLLGRRVLTRSAARTTPRGGRPSAGEAPPGA